MLTLSVKDCDGGKDLVDCDSVKDCVSALVHAMDEGRVLDGL